MFSTPKKTKKYAEFSWLFGGGLLAGALRTIAVAAVLLAGLIWTGGIPFPRSEVQSALAPSSRLSCERGSCQRHVGTEPAPTDSVSIPTGKPRLLEFTSKHCASCTKMAPLVQKMEHECTARDGTILPVDVDTDSGSQLASRYAVHELPTFVMVDDKGAEVSRLVGEQSRERLKVALADVNGTLCTVL